MHQNTKANSFYFKTYLALNLILILGVSGDKYSLTDTYTHTHSHAYIDEHNLTM